RRRRVRPAMSRLAALAIVAAFRTAAADPADSPNGADNFRAELGAFFADFTKIYGTWYGETARFWLLDSTGQRGTSGYIDVIDLHWHPDSRALGASKLHSTYTMGRLMHSWAPHFYTMSTLGVTGFDAVFPRTLVETEGNWIVPQV